MDKYIIRSKFRVTRGNTAKKQCKLSRRANKRIPRLPIVIARRLGENKREGNKNNNECWTDEPIAYHPYRLMETERRIIFIKPHPSINRVFDSPYVSVVMLAEKKIMLHVHTSSTS